MGTASHLAGELFKTMAKVGNDARALQGQRAGDHRSPRRARRRFSSPPCRPCCRTPRRASCAPSPPSALERRPRPSSRPSASRSRLRGQQLDRALRARRHTAPEIVQRWNAEVNRIMQSPEIQARLPGEGARFTPNTPEQFGAFVKSEIAKWAPVVKASGARSTDERDSAGICRNMAITISRCCIYMWMFPDWLACRAINS